MRISSWTIYILLTLFLNPASSWGSDFTAGVEFYLRGEYKKAVQLWEPLAEKGDAKAQIFLGHVYTHDGNLPNGGLFEHGNVPTDYTAAMKWYGQAAEQGYSAAQFAIGDKLPKEDYPERAYWYERAAEQGHVEARIKLLWFRKVFHEVLHEPEKWERARTWVEEAAEQGSAKAKMNLFLLYWNGHYVPPDLSKAVPWVRSAAEHRLPIALESLGDMYIRGEGVPVSKIEAYKWANLAVVNGRFSFTRYRDALARRMTPEEVLEGKRRAENCIAKAYKGC